MDMKNGREIGGNPRNRRNLLALTRRDNFHTNRKNDIIFFFKQSTFFHLLDSQKPLSINTKYANHTHTPHYSSNFKFNSKILSILNVSIYE